MADKINWRVTSNPDRVDREKVAEGIFRGWSFLHGLVWMIVGVAVAIAGVAGIGGAGLVVFGVLAVALGVWIIRTPTRL